MEEWDINQSLYSIFFSQYSSIPTFQLPIAFHLFVGFDGADVMPVTFVDDDPPDRPRFFYDSSDKD